MEILEIEEILVKWDYLELLVELDQLGRVVKLDLWDSQANLAHLGL